MLIECDRCDIRGAGCAECLVTALFDVDSPTAGLGAAEARAIEVFARAGFEVEVLPPSDPAVSPRAGRRGRTAA
ncbi:hypothetical protein ACFY3U_05170 [Micromonospora sp. NPDC000089]|uniref:hypothetical protein n=1 Tax=unclassified Micromonospora TaxID=2617518 RepID=UPI0036B2BDE0